MNPFEVLTDVKDTYKTFVHTFQKFKNPAIRDWVAEKVDEGTLLWKEPFIQLSRRFRIGDTWEELEALGVHADAKKVFTIVDGDRSAKPIALRSHQSACIRTTLEKKQNVIVSTGTGSGKSFCFGIPIISECLKMKDKGISGIKAVIIYPMNALANSQYDEFARRLKGSGLSMAIYTGDTPRDFPEDEYATPEDYLYKTSGRKERYDSELLTRSEIQKNPPDILMTNYAQLELILTRFEDRTLFPPEHAGVLQFLVLDEVHTYTGKRGSDVACLIRRLKQHTGTIGKLRCIGTSATVQSGAGEDTRTTISEFASKLFGEAFTNEQVIREEDHVIPVPDIIPEPLPTSIQVQDEDIDSFRWETDADGKPVASTIDQACAITEKLVGRALLDAEKTREGLGILIRNHPTFHFLEKYLAEEAYQLTPLATKYRSELRQGCSLADVINELQAALLVGCVATVDVYGKQEPRFVPKLHIFLSQGRTITTCLSDHDPHLNDKGELTCPTCAREEKERVTFPLVFCRSCGQELYGVDILEDGSVNPRDMDTEDIEGMPAYLYPLGWNPDDAPVPENWHTKTGKLKKNVRDHVPANITYCPICNKLDSSCKCAEKVEVALVPFPFLMCPSCGVFYDRRVREFSKLFTFGTVGRSTGTDVIVGTTLRNLSPSERKIIAFSDNRQDTALQAAHMNNLDRRFLFRRGLRTALVETGATEGTGKWLDLSDTGRHILDTFEKYGVTPSYTTSSGMFAITPGTEQRYQKYLTFGVVEDLSRTQNRNHQNLEDAGLVKILYNGLDKCAAADMFWGSVQLVSDLDVDTRYDFLLGLLDIMRKRSAINHESLLRNRQFEEDVISKLDDRCKFHGGGYGGGAVGFSDTADPDTPYATVLRISSPQSALLLWVKRVLSVDNNTAVSILNDVLDKLTEARYTVGEDVKKVGELLMLNWELIVLQATDDNVHQLCPKCSTVHHFRSLAQCTSTSCHGIQLQKRDFSDNYFLQEYSMPLDSIVKIEAAEHSGQISGGERKTIEARFRDRKDSLNSLVCTPTMELGINIGDLSAIFMRNVPPNPSNYAQRAGRAGRKGQPSVIEVFCGVGLHRGPHDQYFYRYPEKIIAGKIGAPRFLLDNEALIKTHIHSLVLETIRLRLPSKACEILDLHEETHPIYPDLADDFRNRISELRNSIKIAVDEAFAEEKAAFEWFDDKLIEHEIDHFVDELDRSYNRWRTDYTQLKAEFDQIHLALGNEGQNKQLSQRHATIAGKLDAMRNGGGEFYTYRYLGMEGFLPNYAFPRKSATVTFLETEEDLNRDPVLALREYAPGNSVYYKGYRYAITHARLRTKDNKPDFNWLLVCPHCGTAYIGEEDTKRAACHCCHNPLTGVHANDRALQMPDMLGRRRASITADEEERMRKGYDITPHYRPKERLALFEAQIGGNTLLHITYEHNGRVVLVNRGPKADEEEDMQHGFTLCAACNRWLFSDDAVVKHVSGDEKCTRGGSQTDIVRGIEIYTDALSDVVTISCQRPQSVPPHKSEDFYTTLLHALHHGIQISLNVDDSEVSGFLKLSAGIDGKFDLVFYESSEGGSGIVQALTDTMRFRDIISVTKQILHDGEDGCEKACYECLCNFYNQRVHDNLDRHLVLPFLKDLDELEIVPVGNAGDDEYYQDLLGLCQSSFEKEVLAAIRERKLPLPDAGQVVLKDGGDIPIVSVDFFYKPKTVVFVDGSPHHKDYIADSDGVKRNWLKSKGYRIHVFKGDGAGIESQMDELAKMISG